MLADLKLTHHTLTIRGILLSDMAKAAGISLTKSKYSIFEEELYDVLVRNFPGITIVRQKRFDDCRDQIPLPFDFYLPDLNLIIEADGSQHYKDTSKYRHFDDPTNHDFIKNDFCLKNKIYLLRIRYKRIIQEEALCKILKNLFLQIERSEANYLNCWDGTIKNDMFQISSQGTPIETISVQGSTTSS